jgi:hypothetical protein
MIIAGYEVPQMTARAVTKRIRAQKRPFTAGDVALWLAVKAASPAPWFAVARSLLQLERRAGHIVYERSAWRVVRQPVAQDDVIERGNGAGDHPRRPQRGRVHRRSRARSTSPDERHTMTGTTCSSDY